MAPLFLSFVLFCGAALGQGNPPLDAPGRVIEQAAIASITGTGTCPNPPGSTETYTLPGTTTTLSCTSTGPNARPPSNAGPRDLDVHWKTGNNIVNSSLHMVLAQEYSLVTVTIELRTDPPGTGIKILSRYRGGNYRPVFYVVKRLEDCRNFFNTEPLDFTTANDVRPFCQTYEDINSVNVRLLILRLFANRLTSNQHLVQAFAVDEIMVEFYGVSSASVPYIAVAGIEPATRCLCNGHGTDCTEVQSTGRYQCVCVHNTTGDQCERCLPLWNYQPYATNRVCEQCQCYGHATACTYDSGVVGTSVNTLGQLGGGGRCTNCTDFTEGVNCQNCLSTYFHPSTDLSVNCQACNCNPSGSTTSTNIDCAEITGQCTCKENVEGRQCDTCKNNYFNLQQSNPSGCTFCNCHTAGSLSGSSCNPVSGQCNCRTNVEGIRCTTCKRGFFGLSALYADGCRPCDCNNQGTNNNNTCDFTTGQCNCINNIITGLRCNACPPRFFNFPTCNPCACHLPGQVDRTDFCNAAGVCTNCKANVVGNKCDTCQDDYFNLQDLNPSGCSACSCHPNGTVPGSTCNKTTGQCVCRTNVQGLRCDQCKDGFKDFGSSATLGCVPCGCSPSSLSQVCNKATGQCSCPSNFRGLQCLACAEFHHSYPTCAPCNCETAGQLSSTQNLCLPGPQSIPGLGGPGTCLGCKSNVIDGDGTRCDMCKDLSFNLQASNPLGCEPCNCNLTGTIANTDRCNNITGQCICLPNVFGRSCNLCRDTFFNFGTSADGCLPCGCHLNGSQSQICNKNTGVCTCKTGYEGNKCDRCTDGRFNFPSCTPCNCNTFGAIGRNCSSSGQCNCRDFAFGLQCGSCAENHFGSITTTCSPCNCVLNGTVSRSGSCSSTGACTCNPFVAGPKCGSCLSTAFQFTTDVGCTACNCHLPGQVTQYNGQCDPNTGQCLQCKVNVQGRRCDECKDTFHNLQDTNMGCQPCNCFTTGTMLGSNICTKTSVLGQCPCKANVQGIKCTECRDEFTQLTNASTVGCNPCECHASGRVNNVCHKGTGDCTCKTGYEGSKCDRCSSGYFGFPNCQPCACNSAGSTSTICNIDSGNCPCQSTHIGRQCSICAADHYGLATSDNPAVGCQPCGCNLNGTRNRLPGCNVNTGQCNCLVNVFGRTCSVCRDNFFSFGSSADGCTPCNCHPTGRQSPVCHKNTGVCTCRTGYEGNKCDRCTNDRSNFPTCSLCNCDQRGSTGDSCDNSGQCTCRSFATGLQCNSCAANHFGLISTTCTPCNCVLDGTVGRLDRCDATGQCTCHPNVAGPNCTACQPTAFRYTANSGCTACNCRLAGQVDDVNGQCDPSSGQCFSCKTNVQGMQCQECKDTFHNLQDTNVDGCQPCQCMTAGTVGASNVCMKTTLDGVCTCKTNVQGTKCNQCKDGFTQLNNNNAAGCDPCGCDTRGSNSTTCNKVDGQCTCRTGFAGLKCGECAAGYYNFPNCLPCLCNAPGSTSLLCNPSGGQCPCRLTHTQRQCDSCALNHFGVATSSDPSTGCQPCNCSPLGSTSLTCNRASGQCNCFATTMGMHCTMCRARHFGLASGGCMRCDQCTDDLLARVTVQQNIVQNAIARLSSAQLMALMNASRDLPFEEARYNQLRAQASEWIARQTNFSAQITTINLETVSAEARVNDVIGLIDPFLVRARAASSAASRESGRLASITNQLQQEASRIAILLFVARDVATRVNETVTSTADLSARVSGVITANFSAQRQAVHTILTNAVAADARASTLEAQANQLATDAQQLKDRFEAAVAQGDVQRAQMMTAIARDIISENRTQGILVNVLQLQGSINAVVAQYIRLLERIEGRNQQIVVMRTSIMQQYLTIADNLIMITASLAAGRQGLAEYRMRFPIVSGLVQQAEARHPTLTSRSTYLISILQSTQPHGEAAVNAVRDYMDVDTSINRARTLADESGSILARVASQVRNISAEQERAAQAVGMTESQLAAVIASIATIRVRFAQVAPQLQGITEQSNRTLHGVVVATQAFHARVERLRNISEGALQQVSAAFQTNLMCARTLIRGIEANASAADFDGKLAETTAAIAGIRTVVSDFGAAQATLESRLSRMSAETNSRLGIVERIQVNVSATVQSGLNYIGNRLTQIRAMVEQARTRITGARACCTSLMRVSCDSGVDVVRTWDGSGSFLRYDDGHSGLSFSFNSVLLDLRFRTLEQNGLIFYTSTADHSQRIGLALVDGNLVLAARRGGMSVTIQVAPQSGSFSNNMFHEVSVLPLTDFLLIRAGGITAPFHSTAWTGQSFSFGGAPLYLGGTPSGVVPMGFGSAPPSLVGCFSNIIQNQLRLNVLLPNASFHFRPCDCNLTVPIEPPSTISPVSVTIPTTATTRPTQTTPTRMTTPSVVTTPMPTLTPCTPHIPQLLPGSAFFSGNNSYLQYDRSNPQQRAGPPLNFQEGVVITIIFRTSSDGVLLYLADTKHGQFISAEVRSFVVRVMARTDTSAEPSVAVLRTVPVVNNVDYQLDFIATNGVLYTTIARVGARVPGPFAFANLASVPFDFEGQPLYVGGAPADSGLLGQRPHFRGCITRLVQQNSAFDLDKPSASQGVGRCFRNSFSGLFFNGAGYSRVTTVPSVPWSFEGHFRANMRGGVLMYSASSTGPDELRATLPFTGGVHIRVTDSSGVTTSLRWRGASLCTGTFMVAKLRITSSSISMDVNNQTFSEPFSGNLLLSDLYFGGVPRIVLQREGIDPAELPSFHGCLTHAMANGVGISTEFVAPEVIVGCPA